MRPDAPFAGKLADSGVIATGTPVEFDGRRYVTARPFSARQYGPILELMSRVEGAAINPVLYGTEAAVSEGWLHPAA